MPGSAITYTHNTNPPKTHTHWDYLPRALAEHDTIRVVSAAAGRAGVRAGMSVPEARVYCATLDVREWDDRALTDALLALTDQLLQCSPQVTAAHGAPGTWWVGASGFDNVGGETTLGDTLLHIARQWHPDARVAIADSCVTARAATWAPQRNRTQTSGNTTQNTTHNKSNNTSQHTSAPDHFTIIPPGGCANYLAPAPLGLVPMTEELRDALQSLGLRTAGALATLTPGDVERRWGADGIHAWRLARGDDPRRPGLIRTEATRSASAELASATDNMAPLLFIIRSALNRLVQQLLHDGRAAASVAITLSLDARPQHTITREIRPARPLARVAPLFDQCRALLEKWTLEAPVYAITVSIPATAPLTADQGDLLVPSWRDAAATVDAVFVRLRAALETNGVNDVVVHPTLGNSHRPELAGQWEPADALKLAERGATYMPSSSQSQPQSPQRRAEAQAQSASSTSASVPTAPSLTTPSSTTSPTPHTLAPAALRLLEKPEPVVMQLALGTPHQARWRERRMQFVATHGPERLSGDWWRPDGFARDYWRCTIDSEGDVLLYRDATGWFLQGWYD